MVSAVGLTRRGFLAAAAAAPFVSPARAQAVHVVDVVGRAVTLPAPARRIVLGAWVSLDALSLIHPDPASLLIGWGGENGANRGQLADFRKRFPAIDAVPVIVKNTIDTMSIESVIASSPDVVILSRFDAFRFGDADANPQLRMLEAAGVPVVVLDFFLDPARNTDASMRLLGKIIGREAEAEAFCAFFRPRMDAIAHGLNSAGARLIRPTVLLHAFAARPDCCWTSGAGDRTGLVDAAGGHNIGADAVKGAIGQLALEYVYERNPDIYLATGGVDGRSPGEELVIGRDVTEDEAQESFERLLQRPQIAAMGPVERGRAFAIWHNFYHTPLRVAVVEALARWFHPTLFPGLDGKATLAAINQRFMAVPLEGTFWVEAGRKVP